MINEENNKKTCDVWRENRRVRCENEDGKTNLLNTVDEMSARTLLDEFPAGSFLNKPLQTDS